MGWMNQPRLKDCTCEDWKKGIVQIMDAQWLARTRGYNYTGKQYSYCPWCGKERELDERLIQGKHGDYRESDIRARIIIDYNKHTKVKANTICTRCHRFGVLKEDGIERYVHREQEILFYDLSKRHEHKELDICFVPEEDK